VRGARAAFAFVSLSACGRGSGGYATGSGGQNPPPGGQPPPATAAVDHNVIFDGGGGSVTQSSGAYSRQFNTSGMFTYNCSVHGTAMTGQIVIR
jgi:hypothetical protein